jgi:hypothetical protein|nr:MAG TPA: head to tail adaptor [Caudoviricetes sp.]
MYWWGKPQFFGVRAAASNIGRKRGNYTAEMFAEDFPQFFDADGKSVVPEGVLQMFIDRANESVQVDRWQSGWRYAAGLYVAHYLTMYMRTYAPSASGPDQAAATGALQGVVKSARLGDTSITYDTDALTKATEGWGSLNATVYGQMLASEARLMGLGGTYVI